MPIQRIWGLYSPSPQRVTISSTSWLGGRWRKLSKISILLPLLNLQVSVGLGGMPRWSVVGPRPSRNWWPTASSRPGWNSMKRATISRSSLLKGEGTSTSSSSLLGRSRGILRWRLMPLRRLTILRILAAWHPEILLVNGRSRDTIERRRQKNGADRGSYFPFFFKPRGKASRLKLPRANKNRNRLYIYIVQAWRTQSLTDGN